MIASILLLVIVAGIYFPLPAAGLGAVIFLSRIVYSIGYIYNGPKGRYIGAYTNDIAILGVFVLGVLSSVYFLLGKDI